LLGRWLLVAHGRLLVAILLRWGRAVAGLLLVLAWGRAGVRESVSDMSWDWFGVVDWCGCDSAGDECWRNLPV